MKSPYTFITIKKVINFYQQLNFLSPFEPSEKFLLENIGGKNKSNREEALSVFHNYYSQNIETLKGQKIWLSGTMPSYKLADIRKILSKVNAKVVTQESVNNTLLVIGYKTKVEKLPSNISVISAIAFEEMLKELERKALDRPKKKRPSELLLSLLLSDEVTKIEEGFLLLEKKAISLNILPLIFAIFKVHKSKEIRLKAKKILEKETTFIAKELMNFSKKRNYINAKKFVGLEELLKIKGFKIDIFLYYLALHQKNNLGKDYLASLNSKWTQKLIEEESLFNKKEVVLLGKAGKSFIYAKKIESLTVHEFSPVLGKMDWLKTLKIIDIKEKIVFPKSFTLSHLESLVLVAKELTLAGDLSISHLTIEQCERLTIDKKFRCLEIESITLKDCFFSLKIFQEFLENTKMDKLQKIELYAFPSAKLSKKLLEKFRQALPTVEIIVSL